MNTLNTRISDESDNIDEWFNEQDVEILDIINVNTVDPVVDIGLGVDLVSNAPDYDVSETNTPNITKCVCIEDVFNKDIVLLTSCELIQDEFHISCFIQALMEGPVSNKPKTLKISESDVTVDKLQNMIGYLQRISMISELLANRIGQELIVNMNSYSFGEIPSIVRSSYNFCTKNTQCTNFYNKCKAPSCTEHHYVHSILKYDTDSVIAFLQYIIKNNLSITNSEISDLYLSIKTICFVTKHMAKEINYINYITKNNSETFHRNNPIELNRIKASIKRNITHDTKNIDVKKPLTYNNMAYPWKKNRDFHNNPPFIDKNEQSTVTTNRDRGRTNQHHTSFKLSTNKTPKAIPSITDNQHNISNRFQVLSHL